MKYRQFSSNNELFKANRLLKDSVLIAERNEGFYHIELHQLDTLYMEVFRHSHFNVIIKVNTFIDTAFLEPYLESINIESLL
jgi:hypothetical protein